MSNSRKIVVLVPPLLVGLTILLLMFTFRYTMLSSETSTSTATETLPIVDVRETLPATNSVPILQEEREMAMCPQDVRECSDGSFVSRIPPNCAFELCPSELENIELVPD